MDYFATNFLELLRFLPEIFNLWAENEKTELCVSKENNGKHNEETSKIFCRTGEGFR